MNLLPHLAELEARAQALPPTMGEKLAEEFQEDPFVLLISCLLSLRARDTATYPVCKKLFARARTPEELLAIPVHDLEALLRPIGFFRAKAATLRKVCHELINRFKDSFPRTQEELLSLPGVGRKTANFMLCYAYHIPALCVDTHVHRLANLFGWVQTKTPEETERALEALIPKSWWCRLNSILVRWGQHVEKPIRSKNRS